MPPSDSDTTSGVARLSADAPEFLLWVDGIEATLTPVLFKATESMSAPFEVTIEAVAPRASGRCPGVQDLLGQPAILSLLHDTGTRRFEGVIASAAITGERRGWRTYALRLVSRTWVLGRRIRSRVWQAMTTDEIFRTILADAGFDDQLLHISLSEPRTPRDQCIQYQESDLDFLSRILAQDGMYWFHAWRKGDAYVADEEADERLSIVLTDQGMAHEKLIEAEEVLYRPPAFAGGAGTSVRSVAWHRNAVPAATNSPQYDFRAGATTAAEGYFPAPSDRVELKHAQLESDQIDEVFGQAWDVRDVQGGESDTPEQRAALGTDATKPQDLRREKENEIFAQARLRAQRASSAEVHFEGDVRQLRVGFLLNLVEHPDEGFDGEYLLTSVRHEGRQSPPDEPDWSSNDGTGEIYSNHAVGVPAESEYRPPLPERTRRIEGVHLAVVTGPPGEEIHVDPLLRIKVLFNWDPKPGKDDASSAWVRVMQPWAGNGWGHMVIPRVGQEVIVQFVDGDPDQPIVLGTVYNGLNKPPYELPKHKTRWAIKSRSTPSDADSNEIRFEDKKGEEDFYLHASNSMTTSVDGDASRTVGNNDTLTVTELRKVKAKNIDVTAEEDHKTKVMRSYSLVADKDGAVTTPKFTVTSKTGEGLITLESSTKLELKVGGSSIIIEPSTITITTDTLTINAPTIRATASTMAEITTPLFYGGKDGNGFKAVGGTVVTKGTEVSVLGTNTTVKGDATAKVEGATVTINGSAMTEVKGGVVKLN